MPQIFLFLDVCPQGLQRYSRTIAGVNSPRLIHKESKNVVGFVVPFARPVREDPDLELIFPWIQQAIAGVRRTASVEDNQVINTIST